MNDKDAYNIFLVGFVDEIKCVDKVFPWQTMKMGCFDKLVKRR
jgi:hypothetical protein